MATITQFPDGSRAITDNGLTIHYAPDGVPLQAEMHLDPDRRPDQPPIVLDQSLPEKPDHRDYFAARERFVHWMDRLYVLENLTVPTAASDRPSLTETHPQKSGVNPHPPKAGAGKAGARRSRAKRKHATPEPVLPVLRDPESPRSIKNPLKEMLRHAPR